MAGAAFIQKHPYGAPFQGERPEGPGFEFEHTRAGQAWVRYTSTIELWVCTVRRGVLPRSVLLGLHRSRSGFRKSREQLVNFPSHTDPFFFAFVNVLQVLACFFFLWPVFFDVRINEICLCVIACSALCIQIHPR